MTKASTLTENSSLLFAAIPKQSFFSIHDGICEMIVDDLINRNIIEVGLDDSLPTIQQLFTQHRIHHVLVKEGDQHVGIISDRDVLLELSPFLETTSERPIDRATLDKRAHQVMSRNLVTVPLGTTTNVAAKTMLENNISCLPVTAADKQVVGILTWRDLLRGAYDVSDAENGASPGPDRASKQPADPR